MSVKKFPQVIKFLSRNALASPSSIAKSIKSDIRTVQKILDVAEEMDMISCRRLKTSQKTYTTCDLNPDYRKFLSQKSRNRKSSKTGK